MAISAFDSPGSEHSEEFDAFLRKPVDPFELVACLEGILRKKKRAS
ncbi:MAG TPA: hypothetical protein VNA69_03755 [Thermoanaerobaculia bacterium]|nr:hypothetical protein [Thermoanaerobaculia bacterium]